MGASVAGIGEETAGILLAEGDDIVARRASLIELLPAEAQARVKAHDGSRLSPKVTTCFGRATA